MKTNFKMNYKNSIQLYCVTSFGLKTEADEIQKDITYAR